MCYVAGLSVSPHYNYIDWGYPDHEREGEDLDMSEIWKAGDDLYVGLQFDSKKEVQLAIKHNSMRTHRSFLTVESKSNKLDVKCSQSGEGCPWRMRAILSLKTNNWTVTKWGGRHNCVNVALSQDHQKLDSDFICSCILGKLMNTIVFV